ncbi:uncharacterized protein LOC130724214 [Lotus japonicus]|uniref:uncharacterized protein LOC130724214 n=1 Tax=Lotus japonicus TaxID=34305 RepID=UPI00258C5031|nr:uncharacterized protein LOC130724214 [Lotus japonicus]
MDVDYANGNSLLPHIHVDKTVLAQLCAPWSEALVVCLLGKKLGYRTMRARFASVWRLARDFELLDIDNGFYMVKFDLAADKTKVMEGGPWMIFDHYLAMSTWSKEFISPEAKVTHTLAWIRFPGLSQVFYDESFLLSVASVIGKAIRVDTNTLRAERGKFARVCVELDLRRPVIGKICIEGYWYKVEYEGLHVICTTCGCYGHRSRDCTGPLPTPPPPLVPATKKATGNPNATQSEETDTENQKPNLGSLDSHSKPNQAGTESKASINVTQAGSQIPQSLGDMPQVHGDWMIVARKKRNPKVLHGHPQKSNKQSQGGGPVDSWSKPVDHQRNQSRNQRVNTQKERDPTLPNTTQTNEQGTSGPHLFSTHFNDKVWVKKRKQSPAFVEPIKSVMSPLEKASCPVPGGASYHAMEMDRDIPAPGIQANLGSGQTTSIMSSALPKSFSFQAGDAVEHGGHGSRPPEESQLQFQAGSESGMPRDASQAWNVRGAGNVVSRRHLKEVVRKSAPDVCFVLETHVPYNRLRSCWTKLGYTPTGIEEARGQGGGIWALVRLAIRDSVNVVASHAQAITLRIATTQSPWVCSGVYASPAPGNRQFLWNHLMTLGRNMVDPWALVGDFNDIVSSDEQRGGTSSLHLFRATHGQNLLQKRLDRGLATLDWRLRFPEGGVEVLHRHHSDHSPLLLRCGKKPDSLGLRPFRFEAAWIDHPMYGSVVENVWGRREFGVVQNLDDVRKDSLDFNKQIFGNIFKRKRRVESNINYLQHRLESEDSFYLLSQVQRAKEELNDILAQEEMLWYQKSREKWVKQGDRNTTFFHAQTIIRRKRNRIVGLNLPNGS